MVLTPDVESLAAIVEEVRGWDVDPDLAPLHVGDLGWNQQFGAAALAAALRVWHVDDRLAAVGLLDEPDLLRLTVAPELREDEDFVRGFVADLEAEDGRVLPAGEVAVEARFAGPLHELLLARGWAYDEPWTPLVRDLSQEVPETRLRVEDVDPDRLDDRLAVHHAAFDRSTFTAERWRALAQGPAYAHARSLVGYDDRHVAVAMVTVWAGRPGGPGELEPMGVHRDHRGRGHGREICLAAAAALRAVAAAAALRAMGSSHAFVSTPSGNVGGVATYRAAGYDEKPQVRDLRRRA
ncbi:GNAT family N-acetyltransferase [Nocardioides sp. KIGAM211]|uniref:GNAT family N-acetyltransferase n=1 Tax=Nocardioides luti TaxID=2761101 RepID=A0A7X0RHB9_9ACTN|nr:GNAT family N-acetyltransferase [Nocardioides luti]MBB6628329.1 GNAT family N-acetyltransferase [Nocardioides luti]